MSDEAANKKRKTNDEDEKNQPISSVTAPVSTKRRLTRSATRKAADNNNKDRTSSPGVFYYRFATK